jgi:hypothetical protein
MILCSKGNRLYVVSKFLHLNVHLDGAFEMANLNFYPSKRGKIVTRILSLVFAN